MASSKPAASSAGAMSPAPSLAIASAMHPMPTHASARGASDCPSVAAATSHADQWGKRNRARREQERHKGKNMHRVEGATREGAVDQSEPFLNSCIKTLRQRGDLSPCGQSPMDFESISLATRTHCHVEIEPSQFLSKFRSVVERQEAGEVAWASLGLVWACLGLFGLDNTVWPPAD